MKIGVWVDGPIDKLSGGSYIYNNTLIKGIDGFEFAQATEIVFLSYNDLTGFVKPCLNIKPHQRGISFTTKVFRRLLKTVSGKVFKRSIDAIDQTEKKIKDQSATEYLNRQGIKIIFYPTPSSRVIDGVPYILNNWDLAHYSAYAFPEFVDDDGFNRRNDWYASVVPSALLTFCETETGRQELAKHLNINGDKIKVLPIFSSNYLPGLSVSTDEQNLILTKLGLVSQQFFFYPAQFWAHKNHYTLLLAFQKFIQIHSNFKLVLCGSDKGNSVYIKKCVTDLEIHTQVIFTGFIDDDALYTLYKNARALVMPTFLGPSNIPPLEATLLGCPVLCSNLPGHIEMLQDTALYFDPLDEHSILEAMHAIIDESTRADLLQKQNRLAETTDHTIEKALICLQKHFNEAVKLRNCWE